MRLKSLELHGFKSFPDRTKINFTSGVTVVVGPNGSGKSNISDAIRWVLGELSSKNIRGNKMEDVIFAGTEKRPAMGYAEVSLTIDNTGDERIESDYDEITVTRRLYRSGDSEYLINNKPSRLRDIVNMFFNTGIGKTGYSIIGQGRISEIISQKSEDRRIIFEEAAGISKYRVQKQDSERRLREVETNMIRVTDLLSELEVRVGPLEKESAKARIYLELFEKKKAIEVALLLYDISKINSDREIIAKDNEITGQELAIVSEALDGLEQRIEHLTDILQQKKEEYEQHSEEYSKLLEKRHSADNELTVSEYQIENIKVSSAHLEESKLKAANTLRQKGEENSGYERALVKEREELGVLNAVYNETEQLLTIVREKLVAAADQADALLTEREDYVEELNGIKIKISAEDAYIESSESRRNEIAAETDASKKRLITLVKNKENSEKVLTEYKTKLAALEKTLSEGNEKCRKLESDISEKNKVYASLLAETAAKEQRMITLQRMEEHFEGYSRSVKYIAENASSGRLPGICGPVSKLISTDRKYTVAIETALGANIQNIVVEDENAAKSAIAALKRDNAGRATFYPLTTIKAGALSVDRRRLSTMTGYIGIGSELIEFDRKYGQVMSYLLGRTVIFDNLENASSAERAFGFSFKAVTLDGQVINAGGSYTGGAVKTDSGILSRSADITAMREEKQKLEKDAEKLSASISKLENELSDIREECDTVTTDISIASALIKAETTSLSIVERNISDEQEKLDLILSSLDLINSEDDSKKAQIAGMKEECANIQSKIDSVSDKINALNEVQKSLTTETDDLIAKKNTAYLNCSLKTRDINDILRRLEAGREAINAIEAEIAEYNEKSAHNAEALSELTGKCARLAAEIKDIGEKLVSIEQSNKVLNDETVEIDKDINDLRAQIKEKTDRKFTLSVEFNSVQSRLERINSDRDKLTEKLFEEYELTYADAEALDYEPVNEDNRSKKNSELSKYKSKIRELGSVNVNAIEEYRDVKERYDFMTKQVSDMKKAEHDLHSVIEDLEKEMCERFTATFDEVNKNFKEVFAQLFGGGTANLYLSDPLNVLTSGIEIEVAPPGKIIKNLKLLSGGEQVFVAIAIFFAILKVNPSPFCLLDEIESALDEVNVDRFAAYAKLYSDHTQFIIITHRRGTMEAADTMYGITMQEKGISKVLNVNLSGTEE